MGPLVPRLQDFDFDGFSDAPAERRGVKTRRPRATRRSVHALETHGEHDDIVFTDPSLAALHAKGLLEELLGELKSGKEAVVYLARTPFGPAALKLYKDLAVRSFKQDGVYRAGRYIGDDRIEKAIRQRTATGVDVQQSLWVMHEYRELWTLHEAGVRVPKPLVGPGPKECAEAGRAVLMELVGTEDRPAPRLSDARLSRDEALSAWQQSLDLLAAFVRLGRAHGDFSTYNLLWHGGLVYVIDFPQVVQKAENPAFDALLARDVKSLCTSFSRHGLHFDAASTLRDVLRRAKR